MCGIFRLVAACVCVCGIQSKRLTERDRLVLADRYRPTTTTTVLLRKNNDFGLFDSSFLPRWWKHTHPPAMCVVFLYFDPTKSRGQSRTETSGGLRRRTHTHATYRLAAHNPVTVPHDPAPSGRSVCISRRKWRDFPCFFFCSVRDVVCHQWNLLICFD